MFAAWGDSLTAGTGGTPYPTTLSTLRSGALVYNGGIGGEISTQIKDRMIAAPERYSTYALIWAGHNNADAPTTVKADIATMVGALTSPKYLVLGLLTSSVSIKGSAAYNTITTMNNELAVTYAGHYLDIRAALIAAYDPNNAQDVIDHANDVTPSSLRSDALHLNTAGYTLVANQVNAYIQAHP